MNYIISEVIKELLELRLKLPKKQELPDDNILHQFQVDFGIKLNEEYIYFLKTASDSLYNCKAALRITKNRDHSQELSRAVQEARSIGMPHDWLPICEDNGNYYCLISDGTIRFWDHNGANNESWPSLACWIKEVWIDGN